MNRTLNFAVSLLVVSLLASVGQAESQENVQAKTVAQCKATALESVKAETKTTEELSFVEASFDGGAYHLTILPPIEGADRTLVIELENLDAQLSDSAITTSCEVITLDF